MEVKDIELTATELGAVLGITSRRVRQLAEDGVFERAARGRYGLINCVQAYIAAQDRNGNEALHDERLGLIRAQRRRIELQNAAREGTTETFRWQDAAVSVVCAHFFLRLRPIAGWLHAELQGRLPGNEARSVAGEVGNWLVGTRAAIEAEVKEAATILRREGTLLTDYDELQRALGRPEVND